MENKLYTSISNTPVSVLRDCLKYGNLESMVIEGDPTQSARAEAWANLFSEYHNKINPVREDHISYLQQTTSARSIKITAIEGMSDIVLEAVDNYEEILIELGSEMDPVVISNFREAVIKEKNRLPHLRARQAQDIEVLKNINRTREEGIEEEAYFNEIITKIHEVHGDLDTRGTTVEKLIEMYKNYIQSLKLNFNV